MDPKPPHPRKMSPDETLHAFTPHPAVRRLNRKAIVVLFGLVGLVFAARMVLKSLGTAASGHDARDLNVSSFRATDDMLERGPIGQLPDDYSFLPPPQSNEPPTPPAPPQAAEEEPVLDEETIRRLEQLRREMQQALDSPIAFPQQPAAGLAPRRLVQPVAAIPPGTGVRDQSSLRTTDAQRRAFFQQAVQVHAYVNAPLLAPRSPFEVKAGTVIPAALITGINSDLPCDTIAQVTANVYDSVTGEFLLIPQGTRLLGRYNSEVLNGQNRVLIAWQRLILPNGNSIVLEAMPGTDAAGIAGMADRVDYHLDRLAAATLLSTLVALGGNLSTASRTSNDPIDIVGTTVAQQAARVGQRLIDRELNLQPTILVHAGMPFNVLVNRDLILTPYERGLNAR